MSRGTCAAAKANKDFPSPCLNCTDRQLYCHSKCQKYADYVEEHKFRRKRTEHDIKQDSLARDYERERVNKAYAMREQRKKRGF